MHYCLGANLARVELQEGLAFLAEHLHGLRLDGEPVFEGVSGIYGLAELPIAFSPELGTASRRRMSSVFRFTACDSDRITAALVARRRVEQFGGGA